MAKTGPGPAAAPAKAEKPRRGIQSVEIGSQLLLELARHVSRWRCATWRAAPACPPARRTPTW
jgi:hypothetical protein